MPQGIHEVELKLPIQRVWEFVHVMENWITLVPGYLSPEIINDRQSSWTFESDIGILKKKISLQVDITAKGVKSPMINPILKTHVTQLTTEFAEAIANRMNELAAIPPRS